MNLLAIINLLPNFAQNWSFVVSLVAICKHFCVLSAYFAQDYALSYVWVLSHKSEAVCKISMYNIVSKYSVNKYFMKCQFETKNNNLIVRKIIFMFAFLLHAYAYNLEKFLIESLALIFA
jgi:hypothetical protein